MRCRRDTATICLRAPACACATPLHIHSTVHVMDARGQIGSGTLTLFSFQLPGLMNLPSAGRTGRTTARRHCLPLREFPVLEESNAFFIDAGS